MNEPEKKDGIWIQTNNQYEHILINQQYSNYQSGVWSNDTPLPQATYAACNVSYNNEIYTILGVGASETDTGQRIYKYSNGTWSLLGQSPRYFLSTEGSAIFYNGQLYMAFGGEYYDSVGYIYRYKNNDFSIYSNAERAIINYNSMATKCNLISYNNILYCIYNRNDDNTINACKINNNLSVTEVIPEYEYKQTISNWLFVGIFNGNVYVLCDGILYSTNSIENIKSNTLSKKLQIPNYNNSIFGGGCACIKDNMMHIFLKSAHYVTDGNTITQISTLQHEHYYSNGCTIYGDLHLIGGNPNYSTEHIKFQSPQKVYSPNTLIINKGNSNSGVYLTAINDNSEIIKGNNNRFVSGFDDCFYFADTAFDWNAPMYYGDGSRWIKFKN